MPTIIFGGTPPGGGVSCPVNYPGLVFCLAFGSAALGALTPEQARLLPPASARPVVFGRDIRPLLEARCVQCHGRGRDKGGFRLETRDLLLQGGDSGPAVKVGNSRESLLIELVSGLDPDNVMPRKGTRLTVEQVGLLRAWIDQGLPWDAGMTFAKAAPLNLAPPAPAFEVSASGPVNPINQILGPYFAAKGVNAGAVVEDRLYARRVYLDAIGLLPPADELEAFVKDEQPAWNQDLLDWLAKNLVEHRYDLKHTLEVMLTSRACQMPAVDLGEAQAKEFVFGGPGVRRLSAEEFRDALGQLTGVWHEKTELPAATNSNPNSSSIRAALVAADPLTTALGRPNRDQVVTARAGAATTLQALETHTRANAGGHPATRGRKASRLGFNSGRVGGSSLPWRAGPGAQRRREGARLGVGGPAGAAARCGGPALGGGDAAGVSVGELTSGGGTMHTRRDFLRTAGAATLSALASGFPRQLLSAESVAQTPPLRPTR